MSYQTLLAGFYANIVAGFVADIDIYANVADITNDSVDFCRRMLAETGVACSPGLDFDPDRGHATIRFSFAGPAEDMVEACRRMKAWIKR